jgi:hypothetical protein
MKNANTLEKGRNKEPPLIEVGAQRSDECDIAYDYLSR